MKYQVHWKTLRRGAASALGLSVIGLLGVLLLGPLVGCGGPDVSLDEDPVKQEEKVDDNLELAFGLLDRGYELNRAQLLEQVTLLFNRWLSRQDKNDDPGRVQARELERMMKRLPQQIRFPVRQELVEPAFLRMQFSFPDIRYIDESLGFRRVARWVSKNKFDEKLQKWVQEQDLEPADQRKLLVAHNLFDWTFRNIQTDPLVTYPNLSGPKPSWLPPMEIADSAPLRGLKGPGYTMRPSIALTYGHGDPWVKSRLFIQLARQEGIDSVMLGFRTRDEENDAPWLVAARIGKRLYLFDMMIGLPFPADNLKGICHLEQLFANPKLLDQLSVEDVDGTKMPYRVKEEDLKTIIALIDVEPQAMTRRMRILEKALTGDLVVRLTHDIVATEKELVGTQGIRQARLWKTPFEAVAFEGGASERGKTDERFADEIRRSFGPLGMHPRLPKARQMHLRGILVNQSAEVGQLEEPGAFSRYMDCRFRQSKLDALRQSKEVQKEFGIIRKEQEGPLDWQQRLESNILALSEGKDYATYWLGLAHFDNRDYEASREWLLQRYIEAKKSDARWQPGAYYNLGRALEAIGDHDKAIEIYRSKKVDSHLGGLIRALQLESEKKQSPSEP